MGNCGPSCGPMTVCVVWCLALGVRLPRMWSACSRLCAGLVLPPIGEACVFPLQSLPKASWLGCSAAGGVSQPCARQRASSWRGLHLSVGALVPLLTVALLPLMVRRRVPVVLLAASGKGPSASGWAWGRAIAALAYASLVALVCPVSDGVACCVCGGLPPGLRAERDRELALLSRF